MVSMLVSALLSQSVSQTARASDCELISTRVGVGGGGWGQGLWGGLLFAQKTHPANSAPV